jgi:aryl-alcohol dehydrogenase-like predicted oxidoreductase
MIEAGYVRYLGLQELGADTIRRAAVHPEAGLQIEYSLMSRGIEAQILPTLRELGIGVTACGIMSAASSALTAPARSPVVTRGAGSPLPGREVQRNLGLLAALERSAAGRGVSTALLAIAWVASQGTDIIPLSGIGAAVPADQVAGDRYDASGMAALDSEKS